VEKLRREEAMWWLLLASSISTSLLLSTWNGYRRVVVSSAPLLETSGTRQNIAYDLTAVGTSSGLESKKYRLRNGENLFNLLIHDLGLSRESVVSSLEALKKIFSVKRLKVGQEISIRYRTRIGIGANEVLDTRMDLEELKILDDQSSVEIVVSRDPDGNYHSRRNKIGTTTYYDRFSVEIESNLYSDAILAGVPADVVMDLINLYSFDIDFQRDIRTGDKLEIVFESQFVEATGRVRSGNIIYANLNVNRANHRMYRFNHNGLNNYFDENGLGIRKSLLRTPIDGARITSGYGNRRHPILGYTKAHRGVDFAAPIGTPFYAAGNGVVTKIISGCRERERHCGDGYGNYIVIRHNSLYSSEYAHISRIAKNIRVGSRVRQGEVIGFVGNTGLATGPHLHYGLIHRDVRVNPAKIKPVSYVKLGEDELSRFSQERKKIDNFKISNPSGGNRNADSARGERKTAAAMGNSTRTRRLRNRRRGTTHRGRKG
jgi:murein DD-endopeptidase MepM/ murein hydrolase activator NlpD